MDSSFCDDFKNIKFIWPVSDTWTLKLKQWDSMDSSFCDDFKNIKFIWPVSDTWTLKLK
ncbi:hypothetical protein BpHYR1_022228 [Brachionus plicatilis]|uniref:Uncharacterized protein n=1 Tax=Brachionus plicatilis TaxID=10195 RepID=A0A3M7PXH9_BRAPC|nr:hypothetical protein BpHYR1_022228 [Brachionus plicatilis]